MNAQSSAAPLHRIALVLALAAPAAARQAMSSLVSIDSSGVIANSPSFSPSISDGATRVAFSSTASNLVAVDNNFLVDVFLRDRTSGQTTRLSVSSAGAQGNGISWFPAISGDGLFVAFSSLADNLVAGDQNGAFDVFVRDVQAGLTTRASVSTAGAEADASLGFSAIDGDGRFVAFDGDATNLVAGDTNGVSDIFVRDRVTAQTTRVSVDSSGAQGNAASTTPSISADGRFVLFASSASNLVAGDTNLAVDLFVHDRTTGATTRVNVGPGGAQSNNDCPFGVLSRDGRFVVFESAATNLVASDANALPDVFVRDLLAATTELASVDAGGAQGNGPSGIPSISGDGRHVAFVSSSTNLVAAGTSATLHLYVRDRATGVTELRSLDASGVEGNGSSFFSSISADGRVVAFETEASNLGPADGNFGQDIYASESFPAQSTPFCFGDGSGTACPCANHSAPGSGEGCLHSLATGGRLVATGLASLAADTIVLAGSRMPNSSALYFQGTSDLAGGAGAPFGDGLRCAGGSIVRLATRANVGGASQYPLGGDATVSVRGLVGAPAERTYQVWYRNAAAFCTPSTFNLTNGVRIQWQP